LATGPGPKAHYGYGIASQVIQDKVRRIQEVCAAHGVDLKAAALQFPLAHPAVVSVIPGAARPGEVSDNIAMLSAPIPTSFWTSLKTEGLIDTNAPVPA
jgi:D-threo-aldose 1-dehydrogenase